MNNLEELEVWKRSGSDVLRSFSLLLFLYLLSFPACIIVNRAGPSWHGRSIEIMRTVPLKELTSGFKIHQDQFPDQFPDQLEMEKCVYYLRGKYIWKSGKKCVAVNLLLMVYFMKGSVRTLRVQIDLEKKRKPLRELEVSNRGP